MFKYFRSHAYKIVKNPLFYLNIIWPVLFVGAFTLYYSFSPWTNEQSISGFFQALSLFMDSLVVILSTSLVHQEQSAGSSFNLLSVGKSRIQNFVSLVILLVIMSSVSLLLAVLGFAILYGRMPTISYLLTTILMLIPLTSLILIHLFIAFKFGRSWSIASGAVFLLIGALGSTGLLDKYWYYLPPTWAVRFSSLMIFNSFHPDYILEISAELRHGLLVCFLTSLAIAILIPKWFNKWDGRANNSDG